MESGQESTRDGRPDADRSRRTRWLKRLTVLIVVGGGATVGFTLAAEAAVAGPVRPVTAPISSAPARLPSTGRSPR